jgi:CubicO group peptidase (beta-lactamase class C family)
VRSVRSLVPFVCLIVAVGAVSGAVAAERLEGHWEGRIDVPGRPLGIQIELSRGEDGALTGHISIPAQNLRQVPLTGFERSGRQLRFAIAPTPGIPGDPTFEGEVAEDGATIEGTFRQGGAALPFTLERGASPTERAQAALEGFSELARQAREAFNVPGLAVSVIVGGKVVFSEGFGYRDIEDELPMTPDTLFAVGSTTKAMTATLLGMMVDEGKLDWDEPVRRYLPDFAVSDPMISPRITTRDLLTHRTGLPRHDLLWYNDNESSREDLIARIPHLEMAADLRQEFLYNNLMYMTAGHLAATLAGESWEQLMRDRLFGPLGMTRSNFSVATSQQDPNHALPYRENEDGELERIPFRAIDMIGPAGSVNSTVDEMSQWVGFNLLRGKARGETLIQPGTLAEIHSPQMTMQRTPERPDISVPTYGMGWFVRTYRGHRQVYHGGGIDGFVTSVMMFPDDDLGIVAFDNRGSGLAELISRHAADRILGLEHVDWIGEAAATREKAEQAQERAEQKQQAAKIEGTRPSHPLADYAGRYRHPGYGELLIEQDGEGLTLHFNGIEAPLEHWHYDVWSGAETDGDKTFENQKLLFGTNVDGLIATVSSRLEPRVDPVVFHKLPDPSMSDPTLLEGLTGVYEMATGTRIRVSLSGSTLQLTIPGQPTYELEPELGGRFVFADYRQIGVSFDTEDGTGTRMWLHQPNGIFEAERIEP